MNGLPKAPAPSERYSPFRCTPSNASGALVRHTTATRLPMGSARVLDQLQGVAVGILERRVPRVPRDLAEVLLEHHAALLEPGLRELEVLDVEHDRSPVRARPVAGSVQADPDPARLQLRPLVAVPHRQGETERVTIEGDRAVHVRDEEPDVVQVHGSSPSSFART